MFRLMPHKFKALHRRFGDRPFRLLDIGAGNHSATLTRQWFPHVHYTGVDRDRAYNNDPADFAAMDAFHEIDLTRLDLSALPDGGFDAILMAHVIEHLENGDEVVRALTPKLRPGGLFCLEFPGRNSLRLPSKKGTLNFHDDPTHVRLFTAGQVSRLLSESGMRVLHAGTRRDWSGILFMPLHAFNAKRYHGFVPGGVFWDLFGFADEVFAERIAPNSSGT